MNLNKGISTPIAILIIVVTVILAGGVFYWQFSDTGGDEPLSKFEDVVITLERNGCHGTCPVYKLTVYGDGKVVYKGERFVEATGTKQSEISQAKIEKLVNEFYAAGYFNLKDNYEEYMATDNPTVITSIEIDGKTKTVHHYHGDHTAPTKLGELENKIDEITNSSEWVGTDK